MDAIKAFFSIIASAILVIFNPLFNPTILLGVLFAFDVIVGIVADKAINKKDFDTSKFLKAVKFLCFYTIIIGLLHISCYLQGDEDQGAMLVKTITYVCAYFYFSNIAKNMHYSYPENRFFSFMYFVLSIDMVTEKISPALGIFLKKEKEDKNETK